MPAVVPDASVVARWVLEEPGSELWSRQGLGRPDSGDADGGPACTGASERGILWLLPEGAFGSGPGGAPFFSEAITDRIAVFIDAGFLRAEGAKALGIPGARCRVDAPKALGTLKTVACELWGQEFLRAYWYDGRYPDHHPRAAGQRKFLQAIALTPGLTIRLGTIKQVTPPWVHAMRRALERQGVNLESLGVRAGPVDVQKGVDTLLALDLVRLARRGAFAAAALVAGDRDLLEAVRAVQDEGQLVALLYPQGAGLDPELRRAADLVRELSEDELRQFLAEREEPQE